MHDSKPIGFKQTVSVSLNHTTGKIEGWDSLFAFVEEESKVLDVDSLINQQKIIDRL